MRHVRTWLRWVTQTAACAVGAALLLGGCSVCRPESATQSHTNPAATVAWLGQPTSVSAALLLRSVDAKGESILFTMYLWRSADGRTRVLLTKIDVDVVNLLVQRDGSFTAFAPRSKLSTQGDFNDPRLPAGLADMRLLLSEVCDGPLTPALAKVLKPSDHDNVRTGSVSPDLVATVTFAPESDEVREKVLRDTRGNLLYQLRYRTYQAYDDFHRPTKVDAVVADGSSLIANLRRFEALGDISPERMRLIIPDTARAVPITEFLEHLDQ